MASSRPPRPRPSSKIRLPRGGRDAFKKRTLELIKKIASKDEYAIFLEPVPDQVEGYKELIARPMDLGTATANAKMGVYHTPYDLRVDLDLIWANCIKFNHRDTFYHKEAVRLRSLSGKFFEEYLRLLERDGLSYGPRTPQTQNTATTAAAQLRVAANSADLKHLSMQPVTQRLRNFARARRKALLEAHVKGEPTELQRAASAAADALRPAPDKKQIYDGPFQRLRRFPNAHGAATFPFVRGTKLEKSLMPFPPAWRALGHWQPCSEQEPSLSHQERESEMNSALQYQNYVTESAPIARRILASVLDPLAVVEHDAELAHQVHGQVDPSLPTVGGTAPASPKKRPRHGEPIVSDGNAASAAVESCTKHRPENANIPSDDAIGALRDALKSHNIDDTFLNAILNSSQAHTELEPPSKIDVNSKEVPMDVSVTEEQSEKMIVDTGSTADGVGPPGNKSNDVHIHLSETEIVTEENYSQLELNPPGSKVGKEEEVEELNDDQLDNLLTSNHQTMQNVLRLRALKEVAHGQARDDLQEEEERHASALRSGVVRVAGKLPPKLLIPKAHANALLVDASKEYLSRKRKREEEENRVIAKKTKLGGSTDGDTAGELKQPPAVAVDEKNDDGSSDDSSSKKRREANGVPSAGKTSDAKPTGNAVTVGITVGSVTKVGNISSPSLLKQA